MMIQDYRYDWEQMPNRKVARMLAHLLDKKFLVDVSETSISLYNIIAKVIFQETSAKVMAGQAWA